MVIHAKATRTSIGRSWSRLWESLKFSVIVLAYLPLLFLSLILIFLLVGFELFARDEPHPRRQRRR